MTSIGYQYLFKEDKDSEQQQQVYLQNKSPFISSKIIQKQSTPIHLQIELDNGNTQFIFPKINDNPFFLANEFCLKHNLDSNMIQVLTQSIKSTIEKIKRKTNVIQNHKKNILTQPNQKQNNLQDQKNYRSLRKNKYQNYQLSLYQRAMREKHSKQSWIQHQKINKFRQQMKECTYSPRINILSKEIACHKYNRYKGSSRQSCQSLSIRSKYSSVKDINKNAEYLKQKQKSVFQYLYQDNHLRQLKMSQQLNKQDKKLHFKPKINLQSKKIIGDVSFQERLQKYNSAKEKNLKKIANQLLLSKVHQQKENKNLPKQKSSKSTIYNNHIQHKRPLNQKGTKKQLKNQKIEKQNQSIIKTKSQSKQKSKGKTIQMQKSNKNPTPLKNSEYIYNQRKQKIFEAIFDILDDDQDGKISIVNIDLLRIQPNLMRILFPLLEELEILDIELTKIDFVKAVNNLFKSLNPIDKNYLLCLNSNKIIQILPKFQPQLNPTSRKMVQNTQREEMTIYEFSIIKQNNINRELQKQRLSKQKKMMKECTFHPKVNKNKIFF